MRCSGPRRADAAAAARDRTRHLLADGATLPVVIGALAGYYYDAGPIADRSRAHARRMGVLMATGMIVGESLFGVLYAGIVVASGHSPPFALVGDGFARRR